MITKINTYDYNHVALIILFGVEFSSSYNHNYYYNKNTGDLILEEANDDQTCYYYRVEEKGYSFVKNYLGFTDDQYGFGIFDEDYEGCPSRNENGVDNIRKSNEYKSYIKSILSEINNKKYLTHQRNNSFNISKSETKTCYKIYK